MNPRSIGFLSLERGAWQRGARQRSAVLLAAILVAAPASGDSEHDYVGVEKCRTCHEKELMGNQVATWSKGPHGRAYETLLSEASLAIAVELGLAEGPVESDTCLRCHDSYSLTGDGVPRFILGSGYIGTRGEIVSHEAWILTSPGTPLRSRWGGWYVSGYHGEQVHLGNIVVRDTAELQDLEALRIGNVADLNGLLDVDPYVTAYSDIVALLVIQHQVHVQNTLTRARYDYLTALDAGSTAGSDSTLVAEHFEPVVHALDNWVLDRVL